MLCDLKLKIKYAFTGTIKSKFAPKSVFYQKANVCVDQKSKISVQPKAKVGLFTRKIKVFVLPES